MSSKKDTNTVAVTLGNLRPAPGSNTKIKRLGRGPGSGLGKQCARGGKGQTARKGGGIPAGFEGGQMPLYRRIPKRGFSSRNILRSQIVKVGSLAAFPNGTKIDRAALAASGLIKDATLPVKLLSGGNVTHKYVIALSSVSVSASAKVEIERLGGSVVEEK